jgi:xanthine dehydrogenase accessory factor
MENLDAMVLRALRDWRLAQQHALLATVVRTWGSSPRPVGSLLALRDDGVIVGSVSGGCIEDDLAHRHAAPDGEPIRSGPPRLVRYGVTADEAHRFGLPCGGTLELLLEFDPDAAGLAAMVSALDAGRMVQRRVALGDGSASVEPCDAPAELVLDAQSVSSTFGPGYRLLLIGAGQIADCLAAMAHACGFAVTLCDPRETRHSGGAPAHATLTTAMPDDAVAAFRPDRRSAVVALAHDPKLDDLALLEALGGDAFYVGAIGSRRNNQARRERLATHFGHTDATLARLRGPIGIYIGSKTPAEIAVSVMAEVLAVKNGVGLSADISVAVAKDKGPARAVRTAQA